MKVNPALAKLTHAIQELTVLVQLAAGFSRRAGDPKDPPR
jgi:hypothetical protein